MNLGQLLKLVRAEFLVDAVGYNRVRGLPFRAGEIHEAIEAMGMSGDNGKNLIKLTAKDFKSDQEVRWCPGCGDYAILAAMQSFMPELNIEREKIVFVSGIGCAARFPYYMQAYGMHSIHGRAPAIATGLASSRPDLSVWVVTGDGDALSIGGNHLIHALRRNVNLKILMFNNQVYGLTKGQYSPTSPIGQRTGSTPMGSIDNPFNPLSLAIGTDATFIARAIDTDRKELTEVLRAAATHKGAAFVEIFQNCNIYNDGASTPSATTRRIGSTSSTASRFGSERKTGAACGCARTGRSRCSPATATRSSGTHTIRSLRSRLRCRGSRSAPSAPRRSGSSATSSVLSTTSRWPISSSRRAPRRAKAISPLSSPPATPGRSANRSRTPPRGAGPATGG